jgi:hypothetical protein
MKKILLSLLFTCMSLCTHAQQPDSDDTSKQSIIIALLAGIVVLLILCLILSIKLYQAMSENATLQYQNACFTAESAQEKTFAEIYSDLTKIIREIRLINRRLGNPGFYTENTTLKHE